VAADCDHRDTGVTDAEIRAQLVLNDSARGPVLSSAPPTWQATKVTPSVPDDLRVREFIASRHLFQKKTVRPTHG
jgi:hypothetical protein